VTSALYLAVIRDLASFSVDSVRLSGASSGYGPRLRTELEAAARGMTTLHVDEDRLEEIAGRYPAVVSLAVDAGLPHRLSIRVSERPPVGTVEGPRGRVPVAADGSLLEGQPVDRPLPTLPGRASSGRRAKRAATAAAARLVATAPKPLAAWLRQVRRGSEGWTVGLRDGPELRFGSLADVSAKWEAAAAVLRSRAARGARYLDLRLPDRPAAGGFASRPPSAPDAGATGESRATEAPAEDPQPQIETLGVP
jgi:cell division protein FtsQ